jgi:tetratricopeptide (TPR) repeat protein
MFTYILFIVFLLSSNFSIYASNIDKNNAFTKANELYKNQEYDKALNEYLEIEKTLSSIIHDQKKIPLSLYYNIANTYYRLNKLGLSKAYYLRVLKYDPSNKDAKFNLNIVNNNLDLDLELSFIDKIKSYVSLNQLAFFNLFIFIVFLTLLFLLIKRIKEKKQLSFFIFSSVNVLVVFIISFSVLILLYNSSEKRKAILVKDNASLWSAPNIDSTKILSLKEGSKVYIESCDSSWCKIIYDKKIIAWIDINFLMEI